MASICGGKFRRSHKADKVFDVKYKLISQWDLLNLSPQIEAILLGNVANRPFALISSKMPPPVCCRPDGEPWVVPPFSVVPPYKNIDFAGFLSRHIWIFNSIQLFFLEKIVTFPGPRVAELHDLFYKQLV